MLFMSTHPEMQGPNTITLVPDASGRFGDFGGRFVPETLTKALDQLKMVEGILV